MMVSEYCSRPISTMVSRVNSLPGNGETQGNVRTNIHVHDALFQIINYYPGNQNESYALNA